jgi:hypothetical protein
MGDGKRFPPDVWSGRRLYVGEQRQAPLAGSRTRIQRRNPEGGAAAVYDAVKGGKLYRLTH